MKAASASHGSPAASGSESTKVSASAPPRPKKSRPPEGDRQHEDVDRQQVGREGQAARRTWRSSTFSTTMTWNCRGSRITDSMASPMSANHWS